MRKIKTISCINKKRAIGKENKLLYSLSNDMQNFKSLTMGNVVLMGQNTFESLPGKKPLSGRYNFILTDDEDYNVDINDNVFIVNSIPDALILSETLFPDLDLFVIGGASVYAQFMEQDLVDEQYLTIVSDEKEGDAYYPDGYDDDDKWRTLYRSYSQRDKGSGLSYIFTVLKREYGPERD